MTITLQGGLVFTRTGSWDPLTEVTAVDPRDASVAETLQRISLRLSRRRRVTAQKIWVAVILFLVGLWFSYAGPTPKALAIPVGPMLCSVSISRMLFGVRIARIVAALTVATLGYLAFPAFVSGDTSVTFWVVCVAVSLIGYTFKELRIGEA